MRVLIVDDERAARRRLAIMLSELDVEVVGEAANGLEAIELVRERRPDLLLLDIAMPEVDGFDVARHLEEPRPLIVFQTAYDEYALEAFDHEAIDYLVKPVTLDKLERAIERARARLESQETVPLTPELLHSLSIATQRDGTARKPRLLVRERDGHRLVPLADIGLFRAEDGYVFAHTAQTAFLTDYTLKELEGRMAGSFVRANRSELLNLDYVTRIVSNGDGSATLTLRDFGDIRVARRRSAEVRQALEG